MADSKRYYVSFDYSGPHDEYNTECIYSFDANGASLSMTCTNTNTRLTLKHAMTTALLDLICQMQVEGYEKWRPNW